MPASVATFTKSTKYNPGADKSPIIIQSDLMKTAGSGGGTPFGGRRVDQVPVSPVVAPRPGTSPSTQGFGGSSAVDGLYSPRSTMSGASSSTAPTTARSRYRPPPLVKGEFFAPHVPPAPTMSDLTDLQQPPEEYDDEDADSMD
eukprot:TRINITY_DN5691_c0_g1_i1.p1 TRINITY_DN5691_c0_g1~~TRINITY_DN5691_c0_g1_i1.p1  ORF type:complete len:166 (-),score=31.93 TRINITY_DN5691_c0_g1_i1:106-537(-)